MFTYWSVMRFYIFTFEKAHRYYGILMSIHTHIILNWAFHCLESVYRILLDSSHDICPFSMSIYTKYNCRLIIFNWILDESASIAWLNAFWNTEIFLGDFWKSKTNKTKQNRCWKYSLSLGNIPAKALKQAGIKFHRMLFQHLSQVVYLLPVITVNHIERSV